MPDLDVSFMVSDPMLSDTFTVTRRTDSVDAKGRTTPTPSQVFPNVHGVVTQDSVAGLMRSPDGQTAPRQIIVCTSFQILGVSPGNQPDLITWAGGDYLVTRVLPYSRFGAGTYEVIAQSVQAIDPPVTLN